MNDSTPISTLEDTAIMNICLLIYKAPEISTWSKLHPLKNFLPEWNDLISNKVSKLCLPTPLHERVIAIASRVCLFIEQLHAAHTIISSWLCTPCQCLDGILRSNSFRTNSDGLFDEMKAIEELVGDKRVDKALRFTLASEYYLEDDIIPLWKSMPKKMKLNFCEDRWPHQQKNNALMFSRLKMRSDCSSWKTSRTEYFSMIDKYKNESMLAKLIPQLFSCLQIRKYYESLEMQLSMYPEIEPFVKPKWACTLEPKKEYSLRRKLKLQMHYYLKQSEFEINCRTRRVGEFLMKRCGELFLNQTGECSGMSTDLKKVRKLEKGTRKVRKESHDFFRKNRDK